MQTRPVRTPRPPYDAVVLAGGTGRRFGGDKTAALLDGVALLDRVLAAVPDARTRVVVGEPRPCDGEVTWTREEPPGGGPAAGIAAATALLTAPYTLLLAGDLPHLTPHVVTRLLAATRTPGADGAVLVDAGGRRQHLCTAVRTPALRDAVGGRVWRDAAVHSLLAGLRLVEVAARGAEAHDVDSPADLHGAQPPEERTTDVSTSTTLDEWTARVQAALGTDLDLDRDVVLDLARDAAHGIARPAAPLTTFLLGYAAGAGAADRVGVAALAEQVTALVPPARAAEEG